jgi:hypothetical protein
MTINEVSNWALLCVLIFTIFKNIEMSNSVKSIKNKVEKQVTFSRIITDGKNDYELLRVESPKSSTEREVYFVDDSDVVHVVEVQGVNYVGFYKKIKKD